MTALPQSADPVAALLGELKRHAVVDGMNATPWPNLVVFRADSTAARVPVVYEPCVCVVGHGSKRVHLEQTDYVYDPLNYLVVGVPLPVEAEITEASPENPFLSMRLKIDVAVLSELLTEIDAPDDEPGRVRPGIFATPVTQDIVGVVLRLLRATHSEANRRVLAPLAERELLYHLLNGEQAEALRAVATRDSRAQRISATLRFIAENYAESISIDDLAGQACMGVSTFHHNFKALTSMSPLQYLKMVRLHQARLLMLHEGTTAGDAAHAVGYNSQSQFTREFRRRFGNSPTGERHRLTGSLPRDAVDGLRARTS